MVYILAFVALFGAQDGHAIEFDEIMEGAKLGIPEMQYYAGVSYMGITGPKDHSESVRWFTKAAKQGHSGAQLNLGLMYHSGSGVPENSIRAYVWYSIAKAQGEDQAAQNLVNLKPQMTKQQIAEAQALASQCYESDYKDCD